MSPHAQKLIKETLETEVKYACLLRKSGTPGAEILAARHGAIIAQGQLRRYINKLENELERRQ